jgi:deoxyribodipyrimidine photolyase-related protein
MKRLLPNLPGTLDSLAWPVTRERALAAPEDFIMHRPAHFGPLEDAMCTSGPTLNHSTLSSSLKLKLLNPRACCERAAEAYQAGKTLA